MNLFRIFKRLFSSRNFQNLFPSHKSLVTNHYSQRGLAPLVIIVVVALIAAAVPTTVILVQQEQDNRQLAAGVGLKDVVFKSNSIYYYECNSDKSAIIQKQQNSRKTVETYICESQTKCFEVNIIAKWYACKDPSSSTATPTPTPSDNKSGVTKPNCPVNSTSPRYTCSTSCPQDLKRDLWKCGAGEGDCCLVLGGNPTPTPAYGCDTGYRCVSTLDNDYATICDATQPTRTARIQCTNFKGTYATCCKQKVEAPTSTPTTTPPVADGRGGDTAPTRIPPTLTPTPSPVASPFCQGRGDINTSAPNTRNGYVGVRCGNYLYGTDGQRAGLGCGGQYFDLFVCNDSTTQAYACSTPECIAACNTTTWCPIPSPTPELSPSPIVDGGGSGRTTRKLPGDSCSADSECFSLTCMPAVNSTNKYCVSSLGVRFCEEKGQEVTGPNIYVNCPKN